MKIKRWLYVLLIVLVAALTLSVLTACEPKPENQDLVAGPEAGVYYYDDEGIEYQIALAAGNRFTFWVMGENLSGEYTLTGTELVFDFTGDKADLTATLSDEVITLEYSGAQLRFLKSLRTESLSIRREAAPSRRSTCSTAELSPVPRNPSATDMPLSAGTRTARTPCRFCSTRR